MSPSLVDDFVRNAEAAGFSVHRDGAPASDGEPSVALYGLADTGSVVLSSAEEPRSRSLLPDVHVTYLDEERIVPTLADVFAELGDGLPSALSVVSGPSKSADIEQKLAIGVHGPREVHVVLTHKR